MTLQKAERNNPEVDRVTNTLTTVLFIVYLIALYWILILKLGVRFHYMETRSVNIIPFREAVLYGKINAGEIIMNVLVFIPFGIYSGVLFRRLNFGNNVLLSLGLSLIIESLQLVFAVGAFDVTDIITNTLGGIVGLLIFIAIERIFNNSVKAQKFINLVAGIGTLLMMVLLFLLKMNMLPVRYQ